LDEKLDTVCPRCGRKTLIRKDKGNGKYEIICTACGLVRGELPPDDKRGVV
jgi:transcription initiation factor TFIIIB Brf1 subunit/transcription initiation factor TFIIB